MPWWAKLQCDNCGRRFGQVGDGRYEFGTAVTHAGEHIDLCPDCQNLTTEQLDFVARRVRKERESDKK